VVTARDSNFASVNTSFLLIVENDPGKYVFGFILLFILLFVFGVIIKDFIVDRLQDHHEPTDDVFIDDEEDIVE
jgi:cell division protein FtsW (lipid II flippase)